MPDSIKAVEFRDFGGHADFVFRQQEREQESKTSTSKTHSEETVLEESVRLETDGYVYHPNFLDFTLGGVFGLVQEDFADIVDGKRRDARNDGNLLEFNADAYFFERKTFPVTVFAHRRRGLVPRPFLPSLETTTTDYGFTWRYIDKKTPTSLHFSHVDAELSPLLISRGIDDKGRQQNTELRFETGYHFSKDHVLSFRYDFESVEEEPFNLNYDADEVTVTHTLKFGGRGQHDLRSELNVRDQRGSIDLERRRWREDLRLKYSDTWQSLFQFEALDRTRGNRSRDVPDVDERSVLLSGSLRHQLYQSLTSQLRLFGRRQEFKPDLEITRWGGQATFNYRKTNPWGVLHADYGVRLERNDHRGSAQLTEIIDESRTFRDIEVRAF
ncbi:MAG: hypothetical protein KJ749_02570, partial [Planctomycetes bacterium]|nr:hypothetical protein [Planctomycetota bacterium]